MSQRNRYYDGPISDHFDGIRFFNPHHPDTDRSLYQMLRWKFGEKPARWPKSIPGRQVKPEPRVTGNGKRDRAGTRSPYSSSKTL